MKASELIVKLQKAVSEHGDMLVLVQENGFGGYSMKIAESDEGDLMYLGDKELENLDDDEIKEHGIKVNEDNFVFTINSHTTLFST